MSAREAMPAANAHLDGCLRATNSSYEQIDGINSAVSIPTVRASALRAQAVMGMKPDFGDHAGSSCVSSVLASVPINPATNPMTFARLS